MMRCLDKDILYISTHLGIRKNFVTFINHKKFAILEVDQLVLCQVIQSTWSADNNVRGFQRVL